MLKRPISLEKKLVPILKMRSKLIIMIIEVNMTPYTTIDCQLHLKELVNKQECKK